MPTPESHCMCYAPCPAHSVERDYPRGCQRPIAVRPGNIDVETGVRLGLGYCLACADYWVRGHTSTVSGGNEA